MAVEGTLEITISNQTVLTKVPDTTTFSLRDVCDVVVPTTNDLVDCFADAESAKFDANYSGSKNSLLNFRNYG